MKRHSIPAMEKLRMVILSRRISRSGLLLALILPLATASYAGVKGGDLSDPKEAAQKFIAIESDHSEVMNDLEYPSDMIGPRLTGSDRLKRANDWTAEKRKACGLENVHLEPYTIPRGWERGKVEMTIVLLGAHLDSWDLGTGSTDNGTGSMAVLEAARIVKSPGTAPKRTMRFVLFTGEEKGLMDSKAYVEAHRSEMDKFNVVFTHDTGTGRVKGAWLQDRAEDRPMLEAQFGMLKNMKLLTEDLNLLPGKMNGTDHASFDDAGVLAFAFNQDSAEYSLTHHS
jgi:hypothetical protein